MAGSLESDRFRGSLLGLAVGDAVGTAVEFMPPGSFPEVTGMQGGGKFSLLPGQVSLKRRAYNLHLAFHLVIPSRC